MIGFDTTSKERVLLALNHSESDHVPMDLGSSAVTGIHIQAYYNLRAFLGLKPLDTNLLDLYQQTAVMHEDILQQLKVDTRGIFPRASSRWTMELFDQNGYESFINEWGVTWRKPKDEGYYYDPVGHPLAGAIDDEQISAFPWPEPQDPSRFSGMKQRASRLNESIQPAIIVEGSGGELFDTLFWIRGAEDTYMDFVLNPGRACALMDRLVEYQLGYWGRVLDILHDEPIILRFGDDLGDQRGTRISPDMYRKYIKPRHKLLITSLKKCASSPIYIFLHSCGSVYNIIPDFIEAGFDILNPVQISASKMDSMRLKNEFGSDITFWGGGIDTQFILPYGTPQQVKDEVKRRIDDFAPGGGFVFNPVHNIQFDVPPENIMAMWEAWDEYGRY
jgi:uroporphyrinogen decarboxylase